MEDVKKRNEKIYIHRVEVFFFNNRVPYLCSKFMFSMMQDFFAHPYSLHPIILLNNVDPLIPRIDGFTPLNIRPRKDFFPRVHDNLW